MMATVLPISLEAEEGQGGEETTGEDSFPPSIESGGDTPSISASSADRAAQQLYQALMLSQNTVAMLQGEVSRLNGELVAERSNSAKLQGEVSRLNSALVAEQSNSNRNVVTPEISRSSGDSFLGPRSLRNLACACLLPMRCAAPLWRFSDERLEARFLEHLEPTQRLIGSICVSVVLLELVLSLVSDRCGCLTLYTKDTRDVLPQQEEARRICRACTYANLAVTFALGCVHALTCLPRFSVTFVTREKLLLLFMAIQFVFAPLDSSSFSTAALAGLAPDRTVVHNGFEESSVSQKGLALILALTCVAHCGLMVRARSSWILTVLATASVATNEYLLNGASAPFEQRAIRTGLKCFFGAILVLRTSQAVLEGAMRNAFQARRDLETRNASLDAARRQAVLLSDSLSAANTEMVLAQQDAAERAAAEVGREKQLRHRMVRRLVALERQSQTLSALLREEQSQGCAPVALSTRS